MPDYNELLVKAITYQNPEQIPVHVGILPAVFIRYGDEIKKLIEKYEDLVGNWYLDYDPKRDMPEWYRKGQYADEWGCIWSNEAEGFWSIVTGHPVKTREDVHTMKIPETDEGLPHGFMYLRILDLRGFEEAMIDFFEEPPELQMIIDKVFDYNLRQTKLMLERDKSNIVYFGDDLGMQSGLTIGAEKWRKYIQPCYEKIFKLCKDDGRLVYLHTDGNICEIMQDLQGCGIDMINIEFRPNGLENIERICKGKIPVDLYLEQQLAPFISPSELKKHVREVVKKLYLPEGGLALKLEISPEIPLENIEALLDSVSEYRFYKGV
ncbi:MAG: uroporphyrinogen decarboxylase family protein [Oscillospiraceae bacterium]|nr:uroporphyrinogen decarboxylase family protein [Oscillospiraceae bacterium]